VIGEQPLEQRRSDSAVSPIGVRKRVNASIEVAGELFDGQRKRGGVGEML
jgi:hypothetical protein